MGQQVLLKNSIDTWVAPNRLTSRFGDTRLFVHSTANSLIYFARPNFSPGTIIESAALVFIPGQSVGTGSVTINLHKLTAAFDPSSVTWTNQPGINAVATDTLTRPWYSSGNKMTFDVTDDVQAIVDGAAWFGWRISSSSTDTTQYLNGGQSNYPVTLVIQYTTLTQPPIDLRPNGLEVVHDSTPTLSWVTPGGATSTQLAFQVQVATDSAFTTGLYTSNQITSGASSIDLSAVSPVFSPVPNLGERYWRVRAQNDSGVWSAWSISGSFTYNDPQVVNITAPVGVVSDATPTITWTYSGSQAAFQVFIRWAPPYGNEQQVYDSGIQYSSTLSFTLPEGVVAYTGHPYTVILRVWNAGEAVSLTGAPLYSEDSQGFSWTPSGATPPVELDVTPWLEGRPGRLVRWRYTGPAATNFLIYRERNGQGKYVSVDAAAAREGSTEWYRYLDWPAGRGDVLYTVLTYIGSLGSAWSESPRETVHVDYQMPWVLSIYETETRFFCLVNADIDPGLSEISDVVVPIAGKPYLAQYALQKYMGSGSGLISSDAYPGATAEQMKDNFMWMRENPQVALFFQDQVVECFIYNCALKPVGNANGKTDYAVTFDFVEA